MPLYTADALILRTYKLGESDRIVVFLTRDRGKKRGVAKNARQSRRRFGGALEPMTCGRVAYFERAGHVEESEVTFKVKDTEVGDFLATLAVSETGGSSVRSVAFPLKVVEDEEEKKTRQ